MRKADESARLRRTAAQVLTDRFRCAPELGDFAVTGKLSQEAGYFRFGPSVICYGQCSSGTPAKLASDALHDALGHVGTSGHSVELPFDPSDVVKNLCFEQYAARTDGIRGVVRNLYYRIRPLLPVAVRKHLQKAYFRGWEKVPFPAWPVDRTVENLTEQLLVLSMRRRKVQRIPFVWFWPEGAPSCTIMTHDVETAAGFEFCPQLMDLNDSFGIKSSFQVVPEKRYLVPESYLETIRRRGFEVNVQDLNHDGFLFAGREEFMRRAEKINRYAQQFHAEGFRAAVLYRNAEWYDALKFSYDMSIPNVAHLDPQRGGCCTVLPFFVRNMLELPVTTTQDYSLFTIFNDYSIRLWKEQASLIREKYGLISFIVHPDYVIEKAARRVYAELLQYLSELRSEGQTWIALPGEVAAWWRLRSQLELVNIGGSWRIVGKGGERARLAYAVLEDDKLRYEVE